LPKIWKYAVEDYGVDSSSYWTGVSVYGTDWDAVYVGVGDNYADAFEDAVEEIAQQGYDVSSIHPLPELFKKGSSAHAECEEQFYLDNYGMDKVDYDIGTSAAVSEYVERKFAEEHDDCELQQYVVIWVEEETDVLSRG
jgi:hypothetical protein